MYANLSIEDKLIVGQMVVEGLSTSTISFFLSVRQILERGATGTEIYESSHMVRNAFQRHLNRLKECNYVISRMETVPNARRYNRCTEKWYLCKDLIRDRDFLSLYHLSRDAKEHAV